MGGVAYCDLCEMDRSYCVHGLEDRRQAASFNAAVRLVSPHGMAHFSGCPIRATIVTTVAGPRSHRRMPGNAWETARNFKQLAVQIRT
jgi:hypothetical protein